MVSVYVLYTVIEGSRAVYASVMNINKMLKLLKKVILNSQNFFKVFQLRTKTGNCGCMTPDFTGQLAASCNIILVVISTKNNKQGKGNSTNVKAKKQNKVYQNKHMKSDELFKSEIWYSKSV